MIVLPDVTALELTGVLDRGVANAERVVIRVRATTEMAQYCLVAGWSPPGAARPTGIPFNDNFFWFGDGTVNPGDTIFVFTGLGQPRRTTVAGTQDVAYVVHWGRTTTLFANSNITPLLIRISEFSIGPTAVDVPQYPALPQQR